MDELLGESLGGLLRSSPRGEFLGGIFLDHSQFRGSKILGSKLFKIVNIFPEF